MANTTLGGVTLDNGANIRIADNDCRKESVLTILTMYMSDSDATDVFDFGGVTKIINLTGTYVGETLAATKTWVDSVEALLQGHQDTDAGYPLTFVDDLRGTIKVKVLDFNSTFVEGDSTRISWTIKLVQSSTNA